MKRISWPFPREVKLAHGDAREGGDPDQSPAPAELLRRLRAAEQARAEAESLLAVAREVNVAQAARILRLEQLARVLIASARRNPMQALARWVKHGPESHFLASFNQPGQDK
ncbi:hypothetical protein [Cupriavidus basilensis]|uniref:hypothetical protein n=1 Tax=Cupriavidus basilensis TaxID=68895 RepID=UPI000B2E86FE|nr:hypothetical protein [Cupriavidus basilensis]